MWLDTRLNKACSILSRIFRLDVTLEDSCLLKLTLILPVADNSFLSTLATYLNDQSEPWKLCQHTRIMASAHNECSAWLDTVPAPFSLRFSGPLGPVTHGSSLMDHGYPAGRIYSFTHLTPYVVSSSIRIPYIMPKIKTKRSWGR